MTRMDSLYDIHPLLRLHVIDVQAVLRRERIPLEIYEAARSPLRQHEVWMQGREKPGPHATAERPLGRTVTRADAWWSFHQFGLAVDMVFCTSPGAWSWEEPERGMWDRYHEIAHAAGLRTLSFERPHVEWPCAIDALRRGEYPAGGDREWEDCLARFVAQWTDRGFAGAPPVPHGRPGA